MDLDAFVASRISSWRRLEVLARQAPRSGAAADELVDLYQQVATDLSVVRTQVPDAALVAYLSGLLSQARQRTVGTRTATLGGVADFVARRFPAALYRTRRWWIGTMLISYAVTAVMTIWLLQNPQVEQTMMSPEQVRQIVGSDFEGYYSESAPAAFAAKVWTNNAWVTALCLGMGILGVPVLWLLLQNLLNLAVMASLMIRHGRAGLFFGLITPHGLLELTAVFVAAGIGLRVFWAWVAPGDRTRSAALAQEGRTAGGVAVGLVLVLLVSGVIEGFVTPSGLPTWARIAIGVVAEVLFLLWVFVPGRRAARRGWTGDLDEALLEDRVAVAA